MAGESVGLDLASQSGQQDIAEAISNISIDTSEVKNAIEGLVDEETGLADKAGQADITEAIQGLIQGFTNALNAAVLKTTDASVGTGMFNTNGTHSAQDDPDYDVWDEVVINVPNTYVAADEGKVVSSGALVSQSSATKTSNGTYDTTLNNEIVVAIPAANGEVF